MKQRKSMKLSYDGSDSPIFFLTFKGYTEEVCSTLHDLFFKLFNEHEWDYDIEDTTCVEWSSFDGDTEYSLSFCPDDSYVNKERLDGEFKESVFDMWRDVKKELKNAIN